MTGSSLPNAAAPIEVARQAARQFIRLALAESAAPDEAVPGLSTPPMHVVWVLNNDRTAASLVVQVLALVFNLSEEDAFAIMLAAHLDSRALVGTYTLDVAETLAAKAQDAAKVLGDPNLVFLVAPA
jgi:ATP-dependent Clp protease adaptor protein ClpS